MTDAMDADAQNNLKEIVAVLRLHGASEAGGRSLEDMAREWIIAGFEDADEVADWLSARCPNAAAALKLESAGITPEQAGILTTAGTGDDEDTIGSKLSRGDLSFDEARRIITNDFWNS
ncbi:MAG: hypothetical protein WCD76_11350 [Pyrinomonadaceae bacterium]